MQYTYISDRELLNQFHSEIEKPIPDRGAFHELARRFQDVTSTNYLLSNQIKTLQNQLDRGHRATLEKVMEALLLTIREEK
jgi:hypothetical protein